MTRLYIWGAGGHGKVVLDCAAATGAEIAFLDDNPLAHASGFCKPVFHTDAQLPRAAREGSSFIVAIGDNRVRAACFERAMEYGLTAAIVLHPAATVSPSASIGAGTVVMPGAIVNAGARIGRNCIVNSGAIVEHDCVVGEHVHISPGAILGGNVTIGAYAHLGIGAVVLPGAIVGDRATVGAGAVVLKSVAAGTTVAGVPARTLHPK